MSLEELGVFWGRDLAVVLLGRGKGSIQGGVGVLGVGVGVGVVLQPLLPVLRHQIARVRVKFAPLKGWTHEPSGVK